MNNTVKKPTKKENYSAVIGILDAAENEGIELNLGEITYDSLREFVNHEIELLDNKAAAAAKRAAAKKVEGDALRERIYDVLTDEPMLINDIVKALNDEDVSSQMVIARLSQLASPEVNRVVKEDITVLASSEGGKSKKLAGYRRNG